MRTNPAFRTAGLSHLLGLVVLLASCGIAEPQIATQVLQQVVQRDGIPFEADSMPAAVLDRLAAHRVVLIGEVHFLREHRELVVELLRALHARGFRQLLFEWTQVADWLLDDYVLDGGLEPGWAPPADIGGAMIAAIRDFNRTLPAGDRIRVRPFDVTLSDYGGAQSFLWSLNQLAKHLPQMGPLTGFFNGTYGSAAQQTALLQALLDQLDAERATLVTAWGQPWYDAVAEMVEMELRSVRVRSIRNSNYDESVRRREEAIKWLVDRRLRESPDGMIINVGATHAQKARLWGTDIEWLGEYLVHQNPVSSGSTIVLDVNAARIVSASGTGTDFDLGGSPKNELFRIMHETWPGQAVFLAADDPVFSTEKIPINTGEGIHSGRLQRHFDAFVLLPVAHRIPPGP